MHKPNFLKEFYFLFFFVFWVGGATKYLESDYFLLATFALSTFLFIKSGKKIQGRFFLLILLFTLINVISIVVSGMGLGYYTFVGYILRLSIVYFSFLYFGWSFFYYYRKYIYIFTLISIPFYLLQIYDINFFINNFSQLNQSGELRTSVNYWNFFLYTAHQGKFQDFVRNSGFGIEPGHFGYLLGFGIFLELVKSSFTINNRIIVLTIIGLTTFSTTYFIFLAILMLLYQKNSASRMNYFIPKFFFIVAIIITIITSEVVVNKIEITIRGNEATMMTAQSKYQSGNILNRLGMFQIGIENFLKNPFGHGLNQGGKVKDDYGDVLSGPNTFIWLLTVWGISFLFFLPRVIKKFFKFCLPYSTRYSFLLFLTIIILWLNSSIQTKDYLFLSIFFIGLFEIKPEKPLKLIL